MKLLPRRAVQVKQESFSKTGQTAATGQKINPVRLGLSTFLLAATIGSLCIAARADAASTPDDYGCPDIASPSP